MLLRLYDARGKATADLLALDDEVINPTAPLPLRHPSDHTKSRTLRGGSIQQMEPLLQEIMHKGQVVYAMPTLEEMRARRVADVEALDPGIRRLVNPHIYHVSLTQRLWDLKQDLIAAAMRQTQ